MKKLIETTIKTLEDETVNLVIEEKLDFLLEEVISYISKTLKLQPIQQIRKFLIQSLELKYGVNIGVKRNKNEIRIAEWLVKTKGSRPIKYLLYFTIFKESLLHFLSNDIGEIEEAFVNILAILLLKENYNIHSKDSGIYRAIITRIHSGTIGGIEYYHFSQFIEHLFAKKKTFKDVLGIYIKNHEEKSLKGKELFEALNKWLYSLYSDLEIIAPIYMNKQLHSTIKLLLELDYVNAKAQLIAKRLNVHPNTIRRNYKVIMEKYNIYWKANINLDKLKLHKYFLKIVIRDIESIEKLMMIVWDRLPYNNRIFLGEMENSNKIIYCPSLFCPHLVSENLNAQLTKLINKGIILDYNLREIRDKIHYGSITTVPINPTLKYFEKILKAEKQPRNLHSYTFSHLKEDLTVEIEDKTKHLDYNLLYFLSIVTGKPLLKSGLNVRNLALLKFYEINGIALTDTITQTDFLNQIEMRAKRRGLLSYAFSLINKIPRRSESAIFEIPTINKQSEKKLAILMNKFQRFSLFGNLVLSDRVIGLITGISHKHPISNIIRNVLETNDFNPTIYTVRLNKVRPYQFHELYNYEKNKWLTCLQN